MTPAWPFASLDTTFGSRKRQAVKFRQNLMNFKTFPTQREYHFNIILKEANM